MIPPQIRNNNLSGQPSFTFFIISMGDNAGMPCFTPAENCYSVKCNNLESFEFHFWLVYALFKSNKLKISCKGSVVQYINLQDIRNILSIATPCFFKSWKEYKQIVTVLDRLSVKPTSLAEYVIATGTLQQYLANNYLEK